MVTLKIAPAEVRGFNYHPSYSTGALEDWLLFDEEVWRRELTNGKRLFPNTNTIRIWLSWNAYCRKGNDFIKSVRAAVEICRELDMYVVPCLFNRWHDPMIDCDGIYIDHFLHLGHGNTHNLAQRISFHIYTVIPFTVVLFTVDFILFLLRHKMGISPKTRHTSSFMI